MTPTARHMNLGLQYAATLAGIQDGPAKQGGIAAGEAAAAAMLVSRVGDGFMAPFTFDIGTDAGDWRPVGWAPPALGAADPDPWVGNSSRS